MNESILDFINGFAGRSSLLDSAGRFGANDLIYVLGAFLLALGVRELLRDRRSAIRIGVTAVFAVGASLVIGVIIAHFWYEARPFVTYPETVKLVSHAADASFPSDHSLVAGAAATVALLAWPRWGIVAAVLAILIAVSRVFVGIHYPGDVAGGLLIGAICALAAWWAMARAVRVIPLLASPAPAS